MVGNAKGKWHPPAAGLSGAQEAPLPQQAVLSGQAGATGERTRTKKCSGKSMEILKLQQSSASSSLMASGMDLSQEKTRKELWAAS